MSIFFVCLFVCFSTNIPQPNDIYDRGLWKQANVNICEAGTSGEH